MKQPENKSTTGNVLDTDRIGPLLVKLSLPAFLGMAVQTLYNVINTIFVGHYVGSLGIAGLSIVFPLQMMGMGMGMMVGVGGMSLISRYIGAKRREDAEKALGNGVSLGFLVSAVVLVAVLPFTDFWLRLIGASDAVLPYARDYLTIIMFALIFQVFGMSLLNYTRAEGNARVGMIAMILGAVINITFDVIFIILLDWGVSGAGWATFLSQVISLIYISFYYISKKSYLKFKLKNMVLDFEILKPMAAIGIGAFMQTFAGSLSAMILINQVVNYGGDYALSAFGIIQRVMMFATMPAMVLGQGGQPIIGFNYGARRFGTAVKAINLSLLTSTTLSIAAFLLCYFIPEPIIRIFSNEPELITVGGHAARLTFLSLPLMGPVMIGTMLFQAIGKAVPAFIAAVARPVVFLIPVVLLLPRYLGIDGVWLAIPAGDLLTFFLIIILVFPILRQFRRLAAEENRDALQTDTQPGR